MNVRRIVTDVFSLDVMQLENEKAVKITDLASESVVTFSATEFAELVDVGQELKFLMAGDLSDTKPA